MQKREIIEILRKVYDPDYRDKSIIDFGLVAEEDIKITERGVEIEYKLTAPLCPFSSALGVMIKYALEKKLDKRVYVKLKSEHMQARVVNDILNNEKKCTDLLRKLEEYGILKHCVKV